MKHKSWHTNSDMITNITMNKQNAVASDVHSKTPLSENIITSILLDKESGSFLAILDEERGTIQRRKNSPAPFGFEMSNIENGELFTITIRTYPGSLLTLTDPCDFSRYSDILSNNNIVNAINNTSEDIIPKLMSNMREKSINRIL